MSKNTKNKTSIKIRILRSILILIGIIFLGTGLSFNLLVNSYIENSSNEQLKKATELVENFDKSLIPIKTREMKPSPKEYELHEFDKVKQKDFPDFMKGVHEKVEMAMMESDAEAIVINKDYKLVFPTKEEDFLKNINEYESILNEIKSKKISLNSRETFKISTKHGNYYTSILKIKSMKNVEDNYLVLFIDISNTLNLANQINTLLMLVMFLAGILSIFTAVILSNKIAKPIQELSKFAKNIGQGNFNKFDFDFADKELDELSQIMNKSAEYLDKYDKEQKIFFQNASHELRTPLMSIKGYAEAIKYNVIDKDSASAVILEESDRLSEMVEDLLYISKIDNITKDYTLVECDIREILSNCTLKQKARAINKGIEFKYDFSDEEVLLNCDEKSISRAFLNLIENALRYANSKIIIGCKNYNNKVVIYIEDDGDGIKEEDLNHIFDRFYKGEKGKHGIGLSIVKSIINKHDGNIYAENSDLGAKFKIEFKKVQKNLP
ncbi:HAMP domain-containing sensor histidine kinase [Romboutsia sp.]|uniref:sensor histidine kinase n=1 Tax=Romboutsia sp. TaxID=1965302 RepID=UPI002CA75A96|nr:HAMP domain-containing sensor histidine kinase [Romboutsia sp.]HSQ87627.1 HAMP domain-containing sensor histidine kinase [Romboutsia sp.]